MAHNVPPKITNTVTILATTHTTDADEEEKMAKATINTGRLRQMLTQMFDGLKTEQRV
jgi:hypothetical protein